MKDFYLLVFLLVVAELLPLSEVAPHKVEVHFDDLILYSRIHGAAIVAGLRLPLVKISKQPLG